MRASNIPFFSALMTHIDWEWKASMVQIPGNKKMGCCVKMQKSLQQVANRVKLHLSQWKHCSWNSHYSAAECQKFIFWRSTNLTIYRSSDYGFQLRNGLYSFLKTHGRVRLWWMWNSRQHWQCCNPRWGKYGCY